MNSEINSIKVVEENDSATKNRKANSPKRTINSSKQNSGHLMAI